MSSKYKPFFTKVVRKDKLNQWKCKKCSYETKAAPHTSTKCRSFHLESEHKDVFAEFNAKDTDGRHGTKRPNPETPAVVPMKQLKINDGLYREATDVASLHIDKLVMEMLADSHLPFTFVESAGFKNLLKYSDKRYHLHGRNYFAQDKLPELYQKLSSKIKSIISKLDDFSIVIDEWSDKGHENALLGVTLHFLNEKLEPKHLVLAAEPIRDSPTAENISKILNDVFGEFDLDKKKVVHLLRDGASVVVKVGRINGFESEHCLAHSLQLVIKDAKKNVSGLDASNKQ